MSPPSSVLHNARKEARFVWILWGACCLYTVGYAGLFGYRQVTPIRFVAGLPEWVFWGIVAPWTVATLVTAWYALAGMKDEDLGPERSEGENSAGEDRWDG